MPRKEPSEIAARIGGRLRVEASRLRLNGTEAATAAGCSRRTWLYYEAGESLPDAEQLNRLALAGFDVLYVVTGQRRRASLTGKAGLEEAPSPS